MSNVRERNTRGITLARWVALRPVAGVVVCLVTAVLVAGPARAQQPAGGHPLAVPRDRRAAYFRRTLVDAYETVGSRNPRWDADARTVMRLAVDRWARWEVNRDRDWRIMAASDRAIAAGCDDPVVLYYNTRSRGTLNEPVAEAVWTSLSRTLLASGYAPYLKLHASFRLAEHLMRTSAGGPEAEKELARLIAGFEGNLPAAVAEADLSQELVAQVCSDLTNVAARCYGDRGPMIERITAAMKEAAPASAVAELFQGKAYHLYADDAPGAGVPEVAGSARAQRHQLSRDHLTAALAIDPHSVLASTSMIAVLVDIGSEESLGKVDDYFKRAIADDPDFFQAYYFKAASMNTGLPGSAAALAEFGRQCLATQRWDARVPLIMLRTHAFLVYRRPPPAGTRRRADPVAFMDRKIAMYRDEPALWRDATDMYEGYLAHNPGDVLERLEYVQLAIGTGTLDVAARQLHLLQAIKDPDFRSLTAHPRGSGEAVAALTTRGMASLTGGNPKAALADLTACRGLADPNDPVGCYRAVVTWLAQARLGDRAGADRNLRAFLKSQERVQPTDWPPQIVAYVLGDRTEAELLAAAEASPADSRVGNTCEACFYVGAKRLLDGDRVAAKAQFERCVAQNRPDFFEYQTAKAELARMTRRAEEGLGPQ